MVHTLHALTGLIALPLISSMAIESKTTSLPPCNNETVKVRKEWGMLNTTERLDFINSVKCLRSKPSIIPEGEAPGAQSRYDDFIATHINRTTQIHSSGLFLTWHRQFVHLFEQALQDECGFEGTLPYWNWPLWAKNLSTSPIFDGSETSLSGNGEYNASAPVPVPFGLPQPKGNGGGCVVSGPFANTTLSFRNFGQNEVNNLIEHHDGIVPKSFLDYKPHCFRRDLNDYIATMYTNASSVHHLIYISKDIADFQLYLDGVPGRTNPPIGAHPGGHYTAGIDLWDLFASPSDPAFWLHHGMIDLVYTEWQAQDPSVRLTALSGTHTFNNTPPSPEVHLDTWQNWGYLSGKLKIRDLMSVTAGPYCYKYDY